MRMTDADAIIEWAREDMQMHIDEYHESKSIEQEKKRFLAIKNAVGKAPTIDAVEVVRCKDCKCWGKELDWGGYRKGVCDFFEILTDADGYCYRAVRKDDLSLEKTSDKTSDNEEGQDAID